MQRILFLLALLAVHTLATAQTKGLTIQKSNTGKILDSHPVNTNLRMALVIGNDEYNPGKLKNPVHDATDIAGLLKKYGFEVTLVKNGNTSQMNQEIAAFSKQVREKRAIAVFYFSGHGIQYNNQNFLVPSNAQVREPGEITQYMVGVNKVLSEISYSKHGMNIIILDACRNSPYNDKLGDLPKGLTYAMNKVKNTLIFFATSANDVAEDGAGDNSPFTESLVESIAENDSLELMYIAKQVTRKVEEKTNDRQTPQVVGTLTGDFYFRQKQERKPNLYIISTGISDYKDPRYSLMYSSKGAMDFDRMFRRFAATTYDSVFSFMLTDQNATFSALQHNISQVKALAKPGDIIFVYYNGNTATGKDGMAYLMPFDANFNDPEHTGISQQMIVSLLADLPCKTLLFLDATAGGSEGGKSLANELVQPRNNVVVLSAASGSQFAFESSKFLGTVFSYAISEALQKAVSAEQPGSVDVESLSNYVIQRVSSLTNNMQVPQLFLPKGWQNFVIVKQGL